MGRIIAKILIMSGPGQGQGGKAGKEAGENGAPPSHERSNRQYARPVVGKLIFKSNMPDSGAVEDINKKQQKHGNWISSSDRGQILPKKGIHRQGKTLEGKP